VVVASGQILSDLAQLFFDDVIVVYEPFSGRRNGAALAQGLDE
jgi:hypothetical protein